jgi:purine-binding chemotaxis protein CheW
MSSPSTVSERAGKYLTFVLAEEDYGLEILKVREIMCLLDITTVPHTPHYIKGVVNIRGKVVPIVDLRLKFDMPEAEYTDQTCIIVVYVGQVEVGIIVDCVSEVMDIPEEEIEDSPEFGAEVDTNTILGMSKAGGKVTILLDISKVLSDQGVAELAEELAEAV